MGWKTGVPGKPSLACWGSKFVGEQAIERNGQGHVAECGRLGSALAFGFAGFCLPVEARGSGMAVRVHQQILTRFKIDD
jgi:hypothetical protein